MNLSRKPTRFSGPTHVNSAAGVGRKYGGSTQARKVPSANTLRPSGDSRKETTTKPVKVNAGAGIVSSKQLESIFSLLPNTTAVNLRATDNENEVIAEDISSRANEASRSEEIIDSVMREVAKLNKDKLSESSLIKLLASVYLDGKAKLESAADSLSINSTANQLAGADDAHKLKSQSSPPVMSISEKKKLQWERERAEMAKLAALNPWDKPCETPFALRHSQTDVKLPDARASVGTIGQTNTHVRDSTTSIPIPNKTSPFTPMAFAASQEAEALKREEQRRQWKAELDEQVRQKRLLDGRKCDEDRAQLRNFTQTAHLSYPAHSIAVSSSTNIDASTLFSHPSGSHFSSSALLDGTVSIPADTSASTSQHPYFTNTATKPQFNRSRGFVRELYSNPADELIKARRAEEVQRVILEQIEEKRRLKEEEKAKRLLEDRLEEERLEKDRECMKQLSEREYRERQMKQAGSEMLGKLLSDGLKQAHEQATRDKRQALHGNRGSPDGFSQTPPVLPASPGAFPTATSHGDEQSGRSILHREVSVQHSDTSVTISLENTGCQTDPIQTPSSQQGHSVGAYSPTVRKSAVGSSGNNRKQTPVPRRRVQKSDDPGKNNVPLKMTQPKETNPSRQGARDTRKVSDAVSTRNSNFGLSDQTETKARGFSGSAAHTRIPVPVSNSVDCPLNEAESSTVASQIYRYTDFPTPTYNAIDVVRTHDVLVPSSNGTVIPPSPEATVLPGEGAGDRKNSDQSVQHKNILLQHLSEIRKGLKIRQLLYDSNAFDEDDSL